MSISESIVIRDVWNDNLEKEFELIRDVVDDFPYVAMDTEFPGTVLSLLGDFKDINEKNYQTMKANVEVTKLIQLGLTFSDKNGNLPTCITDKFCIWQFNFRDFNPDVDICARDSIQLLSQTGIDFVKNCEMGVDPKSFGELLMSSGVVLNGDVRWVAFHSGSDFGFLLKLLTGKNLPESRPEFFKLINAFFPVLYDVKHMIRFCNGLHGGLNKVAEELGVARVGTSHQAGSDSLLTSRIFLKLVEMYFKDSLENYAGYVYNLGRC